MTRTARGLCLIGFAALTLCGPVAHAETAAGTLPALPDLPQTEPVGLGENTACDAPAKVTLSHLPPALALFVLSAPCRGGEPVRVTQGALAFAAILDPQGRFHATIPALADPAEFTVTVGDDAPVTATLPVPDLATVTRLALSTRGAPDLHLMAGLPQAEDGGSRLVDHRAPGLPTLAQGGFLTRLGDPALPARQLAEVLTLPATADTAQVAVVADVVPANCGRDLLATLAMAAPGTSATTGAISLSMPACDAVGERLVITDAPLRRALSVAAAAP